MSEIKIEKLDYSRFEGQKYATEITSNKYLSIEPEGDGFAMKWVDAKEPMRKILSDDMLSEWLENPIAYGAYQENKLLGFVEGFLEAWNNRFRITNICVFEKDVRNAGVGTKLLETILADAIACKARMIVLETQSYNHKAISFYQKNGFEIIGFDRYAYSNQDPQEHNMRIEMGRMLSE